MFAHKFIALSLSSPPPHTHTHTHTHVPPSVVAFLVALNQNKELLGSNGLLPIPLYISQLRQHFRVPANASTTFSAFNAVPTILWWVPEENTDFALDCIASAGMGLSALLVVLGAGNSVIFAVLWMLYHSLVNVGQRWCVCE